MPASLVAGDDPHDDIVQPAVLFLERLARRHHGVHQFGRERIVRHRGAHRLVESRASDLAQADAERLQRMPEAYLDVDSH